MLKEKDGRESDFPSSKNIDDDGNNNNGPR